MSSDMTNIGDWVRNGRNLHAAFLWACPHCGNGATITNDSRRCDYVVFQDATSVTDTDLQGFHAAYSVVVTCPNTECQRYSLYSFVYPVERQSSKGSSTRYTFLVTASQPRYSSRLIPPTEAKAYPDFVPEPIRRDYTEAYLVRDISPKASATLARRCLQGMIRDFYEVRKNTLYEEIEAIKDKVDPLTWSAIDSARNVGNIGAHMEKDINLIVEVEPKEAAAMLRLIEMLIKDWYINRHEREMELEGIVAIGEQKKQARGLLRRPQT